MSPFYRGLTDRLPRDDRPSAHGRATFYVVHAAVLDADASVARSRRVVVYGEHPGRMLFAERRAPDGMSLFIAWTGDLPKRAGEASLRGGLAFHAVKVRRR
jgi:hypothetical protein